MIISLLFFIEYSEKESAMVQRTVFDSVIEFGYLKAVDSGRLFGWMGADLL